MDSGVKRIYVLVNGRALVPAKRMVLSPRTFRTWDAILRHLSSTLGINVQGLYDLQSGEQIAKHAGLAGLEDGWRYVAVAAGEKLKRNVEYLFPDGPVKPAANGDEILARKNSIGPHAPPVVRRLVPRAPASSGRFGPQSKGLRVFLFSNGDDSNQAISVVLNIRNCQSFSHLLETVTLSLRHPAYVRRLYNAETYLPITDLGELHDGISLVALAQGSLKIVHYRIPEASDGRRHEPDGAGDSQHTGTSVQICVFLPNGVPFHSGTRVTVSRGRFENLNKLLAHLAQHLKLSYGRPKRLYALPSGRRIHSIQELLDSACTHFSVATNNEPFIPCDYLNSRELKPPTAGADFANPRANSPSWFIEGETDRSRSAPGNMQRTNAAAAPGAATKTKAPKAPSKPVKSFMDTLEMSKRWEL
ncbi:hypothetical protein DFJ74DRAFT_725334 [Hyaloraphidium curvatum]|nr:hypothetical protein DFJ74DRAFT_725334 [Hyaloraphidium curvatum]